MGLQNGEKTSINIYYNYKDSEFELLSDRQLRNVIYCLIDIDKNGTITEEETRYEEIQNDKTSRLVFKSLLERTSRASKAWHRINNIKKGKREIKSIMESEGCTEAAARKMYEELKSKETVIPQINITQTQDLIYKYYYVTKDEKDASEFIEIVLEKDRLFNSANLPSEEELKETEECGGRDILYKTIDYGNHDAWTYPYQQYLEEILATQH